jgi:hypothetical protein
LFISIHLTLERNLFFGKRMAKPGDVDTLMRLLSFEPQERLARLSHPGTGREETSSPGSVLLSLGAGDSHHLIHPSRR